MGIFNGGSFPTSGGTTIISQDGDQTLTLVGSILTISGTNSSVDLSGFLDDTNTTNTTLVLNGNTLELTDSAANTITADLSGLTLATPTLQEVTDAGNGTTNDIEINSSNPYLILKGNNASYTNAAIQLISENASEQRGLGVFMYNANSDFEWYSGTPYQTSDNFMIGRKGSLTAPSSESTPKGITAQLANSFLTINNSGNVGIGTTSPSAKLEVNDSSNNLQMRVGSLTAGISPFVRLQGKNTAGDTNYYADIELDSENGKLIFNDAGTSSASIGQSPMVLDFNGNVGIGTTSPSAKLDIVGVSGSNTPVKWIRGGSSVAGYLYSDGGGSGIVGGDGLLNNTGIYFVSNTRLDLRVGGSERMRIDSAGNIGIGTTSPVGKLEVRTGTSGVTMDIANQSDGSFSFANNAGGSPIPTLIGKSNSSIGLSLIAATSDGNSLGDMRFNVRENDNSDFTTITSAAFKFTRHSTDLLSILRNGNVGIGTSSPAEKLEIADSFPSLRLTNTSTTGTIGDVISEIEFYSSDTSGNYPAVAAAIKAINESTFGSTTGLGFFVNADSATETEALRINSSKQIGIGTSTPSAKLHIVGGGGTGGGTALLVENAEGSDLLKVEDNSDTTVFGELKLAGYTSTFYDGTPNKFLGVDASGNVIKTSSVLTSTPTLQEVIDAGGSYSGTDDNVSITCGGEGEFSATSNITTIASTGGTTSISGAGVNIGGGSTVNINPTAGGVYIIPTSGDVDIDPVDGDINLKPPSGHKIYAGGTGAKLQIPTWATSSDRPTVSGFGDAGVIGYNIADAALELWNGSAWVTI